MFTEVVVYHLIIFYFELVLNESILNAINMGYLMKLIAK